MPDPSDAAGPSAAPRRREPLRWHVVLAWGLVCLALIAVVTLGEWYRGVTGLQQPPGRPELAGPADGLRTLVWTDKGGVASSEEVRLYVLCDNRTAGVVEDLRFLSFETPGFEKVEDGCWHGGKTPVCSVDRATGAARPTGLPRRLASGQAVVVFASLRPRPLFGRHGASGLLAWRDAQGRDVQRAVILPGIEVHSALLDWIAALGKAIQVGALPIVLAVLAWYLKRQDDERKAREENAKAERERQEARRQERRIRLQETWNLELPRVADNITAHYMPAASAIDALLRKTIGLDAKASDEEVHHALYRLLRLNRRMADLAEKIGGLYFKDLEGEARAGECWNLFQKALERHFGGRAEEAEARVLDAITPQISLAQFMDLVRGPHGGEEAGARRQIAGSLEQLACRLRAWVAGQEDGAAGQAATSPFRRDLVALELLLVILAFEMNRPLELWYGRLPPFESAAFGDAVGRLTADRADLAGRLRQYQANCERAVRESAARWKEAGEAAAGSAASPGAAGP